MSKYKLSKQISFCYGHRLINYEGKCKNLHGHNAVLEVEIASNALNENGMVVESVDLISGIKDWIEKNIDHKLLLNKKDPMVPELKKMGEPYFLLDENPTAENIAKLIFDTMRKMGVAVTEIRLWETSANLATYSG